MTIFLRMLELRLPYMRGRSDRIANGCEIFGKRMSFGGTKMFSLLVAAKFHDIGMTAVPDRVLYRNGALSEEEIMLMNEHPHMGGFLISKAYPDFPEAAEGIWYHHEKPNGKGIYRLTGSEIPKIASIISLVGAVESMAQGRPHRPAMPLKDIYSEVNQNVDRQFSRSIVAIFSSISEEVYEAVGPEAKSKEISPFDVYELNTCGSCAPHCGD